jgi:hypothetical protein
MVSTHTLFGFDQNHLDFYERAIHNQLFAPQIEFLRPNLAQKLY